MKKSWLFFLILLGVLGFSGGSNAALVQIGTAQFGGTGTEYKLIYEEAQQLVWLDYSASGANWSTQNSWATGLNLTVNLDSLYVIDWTDNGWRLPSTNGVTGFVEGRNTEMGHLYYTSLGNQFKNPFDGGGGLVNTGPFENLKGQGQGSPALGRYWTGDPEETNPQWNAYAYWLDNGYQNPADKTAHFYALAVREGAVTVVPLPAAGWLFLSALAGLGGLAWRRQQRMA